ncbi:hypothetical protein R50076_30130 [Gilvimarinus japonicus]
MQAVASDSDGELGAILWRQVAGPSVALRLRGNGEAEFTAPSTGAAAEQLLSFEASVEDDDGASMSDTVLYTVLRVNQAPVVNAGALQVLSQPSRVTLSANTYDVDGSVESFSWEQLEGTPVVIEDANTLMPQFNLPAVEGGLGEDRYVFQLSAVDNDGVSSSDNVTVVLIQENSPEISLDFPPSNSGFDGEAIAAYGQVEAFDGATVEQVTVSSAIDSIIAVVSDDGHWRVNGLLTDTQTNVIDITIAAVDDEGRSSYMQSKLFRSGPAESQYGEAWSSPVAVVPDPMSDMAWILAQGEDDNSIRIALADLVTGDVAETAMEFEQLNDTILPVVTDMALSQDAATLLISGYYEGEEGPSGVVLKVNLESMTLSTLYQVDENSVLNQPASLAIATDGLLYITDVIGSKVVSMDVITGEWEIVADGATTDVAIGIPQHIVWTGLDDEAVIAQQTSNGIDLVGLDFRGEETYSRSVANLGELAAGPITADTALNLIANELGDKVYVLSQVKNTLSEINIVSGEVVSVVDGVFPNGAGAADMVFSGDYQRMYIVAKSLNRDLIYSIDMQSGTKVQLTQVSM